MPGPPRARPAAAWSRRLEHATPLATTTSPASPGATCSRRSAAPSSSAARTSGPSACSSTRPTMAPGWRCHVRRPTVGSASSRSACCPPTPRPDGRASRRGTRSWTPPAPRSWGSTRAGSRSCAPRRSRRWRPTCWRRLRRDRCSWWAPAHWRRGWRARTCRSAPSRVVRVWGRRPERAGAWSRRILAGFEGAAVRPAVDVAPDLEAAVREADVVSVATTARCGARARRWLRPGQHLDLVGAFTPSMRESDVGRGGTRAGRRRRSSAPPAPRPAT